MEEILVAASEEESGAMIPAETVLDPNTEYDWKNTMYRFNEETQRQVQQGTYSHCQATTH